MNPRYSLKNMSLNIYIEIVCVCRCVCLCVCKVRVALIRCIIFKLLFRKEENSGVGGKKENLIILKRQGKKVFKF